MDKIAVENTAKAELKKFRVIADGLILSVPGLIQSREVSLTNTELQRAKMWLGKAMGETGNPTPYPNSENPENKTIEAQADHKVVEPIDFSALDTQVARVKHFRSQCQEWVDNFKEFLLKVPYLPTSEYWDYILKAKLSMEEAKMWLGMELNRIREIQDNDGKIPTVERVNIALY